MAAKYGYFQEYDSEQFAFFRIPKVMITDPAFAALSLEAVFLYGIFLDRTALSRKNGWIDDAGHVYIIYPLEEIMLLTGRCKNKILSLMRELTSLGLLERKRQGLNLPNIIYVKNFSRRMDDSIVSENELLEVHNKDYRKFITRTSGSSKYELQEVHEMNSSNTNKNKTDISDTDRVIYAKAYGRFNNVFLTEAELDSFSREYPTVWMELVNRLSNYMASTGKKYENHYATLCLWASREMPVKNIRNYEDTGVEHL